MLALEVIFLALLGGAFGSFAGVVAARGWHASLGGRSRCDSCGQTLAWLDLVPLVSYAMLRGRCRRCGERIGWMPLAWELGGALLIVAAVLPVLVLTGRT